MNIMLLDKVWGGCHLEICFTKIDLLPRITLSELTGCMLLNIGFLMLTFNLCIFSSEIKEFNRKLQSGELEKEMQEMCEKMGDLLKKEIEESTEQKE
jgi:hypothetical protein